MKIHVSRVPAGGLREEASYEPRVLDMERFDIHLETPITVSSVVTKAERELVVQAQIHCVLQLSCARCLAPFQSAFETSAILTYEVEPTDVVDITEDIRQEIILGYPMIPICQEACKGLCPVCGQNLNAAACQHQQQPQE